MTTLEFDSGLPLLPRAAASHATAFAPSRRSRLAIVSTNDELCGIAAYTRCLEKRLREAFDVTVFELDQYLLRSTHRRVRRLADRHIRDICKALPRYDAVNLQLEHGTLGLDPGDINRRMKWLAEAARRISVTFHTVFPVTPLDIGGVLHDACRLDLVGATRRVAEHRRLRRLARGPVRTLRHVQRLKPTSVIVHNGRDLRQMRHVHGLRDVYEHPLSFLGEAEAEEVRGAASRRHFPLLDAVPDDATLIGVFGFFGRYKGIETAVRALHHLPRTCHLAIFGGVHPKAIKPYQSLDPVISSVFEAGFVDASLAERIAAERRNGAPGLTVGFDASLRDLLTEHPKDLSERMHFLGPMSDRDFLTGMALCDAAVFPYLEVGQSASGPISQALELGCRIIAARTQTFLQFGRYHRDMIEFFDIGNHLELAARILARPQFEPHERRLDYTVETNKAIYIAANGGMAAPAVTVATAD